MTASFINAVDTSKVYDIAIKTPLQPMTRLSEKVGNTVLLKREDLQPIFSFKCRGAYQKIGTLSKAEKEKGIIAASAGNHAQGVALSCKKLKLKATIVMPKTTPAIKIDAVRRHGAKVVLHGDSYDDAYTHAKTLQAESDASFIHPYDDEDVIIGQATIAKEILEQLDQNPYAIFIPVGGGGLAAGVAQYIRIKSPKTKIIAVESEDSACLHAALQAQKRVILSQVGIFAEGVAVKQIGKIPYAYLKDTLTLSMTVTTDEICAAIKDTFDDVRSVAEPAGAIALAGLKKYLQTHALSGKTLVAIHSGANTNFDRLRHIAERAEIGEQKEALFAVQIKEKPGSFRKFCQDIGKKAITEFNYRYADPQNAHIFLGVELKTPQERGDIFTSLEAKKYSILDLTNNECAKLHLRHIVGGKSPDIQNECLFRIEFPERPGALIQFLDEIGSQWNISLFHYRNHGAAYGRVLVGIQLSPKAKKAFIAHLKNIQYPFVDEGDNKALKLFI